MGVARTGNSFTSAINRWSIRTFERSRRATPLILTAELEALEQAFSTLDTREKAARVDSQRATARDLGHQAQQKHAELAELNAQSVKSDTPRGAGGLMSWTASKAVGQGFRRRA
jgi:hypothetical protein